MCRKYSKEIQELALKTQLVELKKQNKVLEYNLKVANFLGSNEQIKTLTNSQKKVFKAIEFQQTNKFKKQLDKLRQT